MYYAGTLLIFIAGNLKSGQNRRAKETPPVSVIVAVRNGAASVPVLCKDLETQVYAGQIEFIFVDDESTDNTKSIIQNLARKNPRIRYCSSADGAPELRHKKKALDAGIKAASFDHFLFTDVDCRVTPAWAAGMMAFFADEANYVIGYSGIGIENTVVSRFQHLDFFMLMAAANGITRLGYSWACTGQNQAYKRDVFESAGGFLKISTCLQGDDSLFLQVAQSSGMLKTVFADDPRAFVTGRTEKTWESFLRQRMRWSGDANLMWRYNPLFFISILATFLINVSLTLLFIHNLLFAGMSAVFMSALAVKLMLELALYSVAGYRLKQPVRLMDFFSWFIIQIPYITLMGLAGFFAGQAGWRGRK